MRARTPGRPGDPKTGLVRSVWAVPASVCVAGAIALACASPGVGPPGTRLDTPGGHVPVVIVPGVTGTKLYDSEIGEYVWGTTRQLFVPRDQGARFALPLLVGASPAHSVAPQARYDAPEPIWQLRLPGWTKMIYRPLLERFERAGYRYGELAAPGPIEDLFFFNYDWRYGNLESVKRLDRQLEALTAGRATREVDLVCQSNAAKICRWLAKYGALDLREAEAGAGWRRGYRIRKLVLVGASNSGALRVLKLLHRGRTYFPLVGRRLAPEVFFTLRPLFEDLPAARDDLFFDERGRILDVDLFEARNWVEYGWSIFGRGAQARLARAPRVDLFGDREQQLDFLRLQLENARRLQRLLSRDAAGFGSVEYYRLENTSSPTIDRALLTRKDGRWETYFLGDRRVDRNPALRRLASAAGDAHATLASQRGLSPQEQAALAGVANVSGGHFEVVVEPDGLQAILSFLSEGEPDSVSPGINREAETLSH